MDNEQDTLRPFNYRKKWIVGTPLKNYGISNNNVVTIRASTNYYDWSSITEQKLAVAVRNAEFCHRGSQQKVLNGLSITVPQGCIYGLTGSSGCGKTTLISCILTTRKLDKGEIFLFGCNINNPNRQDFVDIPGRHVGYMPQDISLYSKFTMLETLVYFGRLYGIKMEDIVEKSQNILELLQFNKRSIPIEQLSGGQKRRVSFAVALIHSPKLLVLDEPTVGMDPLLRLRIWDYLRDMVKEQHVTAIITSHYLDEMRKADKVGIMRNGSIIAEDSPEALLTSCNVESLDQAVLYLCKNSHLSGVYNNQGSNRNEIFEDSTVVSKLKQEQNSHSKTFKRCLSRIKVLTGKNLSIISRNIPFLLFVICIPSFQLLSILIAGREPYPQKIGVFNQELLSISSSSSSSEIPGNATSSSVVQHCPNFTEKDLSTCNLQLLSCIFLHYITKRKVTLINFQSENDAISAVDNGLVMGYIKFSSNFSTSVVDRALNEHIVNGTVDKDLFDNARILVRFDQSNTITHRLIDSELLDTQERFLTSVLSGCTLNPKFTEYPVQYGTPIYGIVDDVNYGYQLAPGTTMPFLFYYTIVSSGIHFMQERNCGMLERSLISGVKFPEILTAHLLSEFILVVLQSVVMYALLAYNVVARSVEMLSHVFVFLLFILSGYTGVSLGFLLGSLCREEVEVGIISLAFILPNICLSGIIWPIQAMPYILQPLVHFLPCTLSAKSMHYIWNCGSSVNDINVWPGALVLLAYILVINFVTLLYHRYVRK